MAICLAHEVNVYIALQRRLSGMERDLAAIQAKLDSLEQEADSIGTEHPEEAAIIRERITQIQQIWEQLTQMVSVNIAFLH
jgi:spectrin beta